MGSRRALLECSRPATSMTVNHELVHSRRLPAGEEGARFVSVYRRFSLAGLAPEVLDVTDDSIATRKYPTLTAWLHATPSSQELAAMGRRLYERLEEMHQHGICHRDVHDGNVVLRDGEPLFIDFAFAFDSDLRRPCYDLEGPERSGVPVPTAHLTQDDDHRHGVWWDAPVGFRTLAHHFGPLRNHRGY
jgi:hypothetical protein